MNEDFNNDELDDLYNDAIKKIEEDSNPYKDDNNEEIEEEDYFKTLEEMDKPTEETPQIGEEFNNYYKKEENPLNGIYPNGEGPSETQVELFKKQYPTCSVFAVEVAEQFFTCRTVTRAEYKNLNAMALDQLQREEAICMKCVLEPMLEWSDLVSLRAGVISTLASIIMEQSGFTDKYGVKIL